MGRGSADHQNTFIRKTDYLLEKKQENARNREMER